MFMKLHMFQKKGIKLTGTFWFTYFKECIFKAIKVEEEERPRIDISE